MVVTTIFPSPKAFFIKVVRKKKDHLDKGFSEHTETFWYTDLDELFIELQNFRLNQIKSFLR